MLDAGLEAEGKIERHGLGPAGRAAVPPAPQLDLTRERHQPARRPAVPLHRSAAGRAGVRHRERCLEARNELAPQPHPDLGQRRAHGPLERTDVGMLRRKDNLERDRTLHLSPSVRWCFDNTDSVMDGLTP